MPHDMVATVFCGCGSMLSAIISTKESERALVSTLSALVPASASGLLSEVVVADACSADATAEVADIAGCKFVSSDGPLGERLKAASEMTRSPWLLFLRAGVVPQPSWITAADHFMQTTSLTASAAVFRPPIASRSLRPTLAEIAMLVRVALGGAPTPAQGLLIARRFYSALGGHSRSESAETDLLRRLGRRRTAMLPVQVSVVD